MSQLNLNDIILLTDSVSSSKVIEENICKYLKSLGLKSRTTSYSCSKDDDEYDETLLLNRPLPWVVRVFFQYENSIKGVLCSGKAFIDPKDFII